MIDTNRSALDVYSNKVFKILIIFIPLVAIFSGITFTTIKLFGFYQDVSLTALLIFDSSNILYLIIGLIIRKYCDDKNGILIPKIEIIGKIFIAIVEIVQWNYITYMIQSRGFWAYSIFFIILAVFFLDYKYLTVVMLEIGVSMVVSWFILPEALLPVCNQDYLPEIILRGVVIVLSYMSLWLISYAIETSLASELEKIADYDPLTLLYNRRLLNKIVGSAIIESKKNNNAFSLLMCDIDDFKKLNDVYGHPYGDKILKDIASEILRSISIKDKAFRYGGEEFLVLTYGDTKDMGEKIRKAVESNVKTDKNKSVTVTIGAVKYTENQQVEDLIKSADINLYYGKKHGKNCVII